MNISSLDRYSLNFDRYSIYLISLKNFDLSKGNDLKVFIMAYPIDF